MEPRPRIALLIDAENVPSEHADQIFCAVRSLGDPIIRRAYGDWSTKHLAGWQTVGRVRGIREMQHSPCASGKNASDIALAVDAVDLMHTTPVHEFAIVSGDSDFTPLATLLRERGHPVHGFGNIQTSDAFRAACSSFVELHARVSPPVAAMAVKAVHPSPKAVKVGATAKSVATTKKVAATKSAAKKTAAKKTAAKKVTPTPQNLTPKVEAALRAGIKASADGDGWASLSALAKQLGPGIRPNNFGHATWTKFFNGRKGFEIRNSKTANVSVRSTV
jgi:hypothetical protein